MSRARNADEFLLRFRRITSKYGVFCSHLNAVKVAAQHLPNEVNRLLGTSLKAYPLTKHYRSEEDFAVLTGGQEQNPDEFLVVTGDKTHYLLPDPSVPDCPYHEWRACQRDGVPSNPGPIMDRSVEQRSFFVSEDFHHCAHGDVCNAKASPIAAGNRARCGARSGQEGLAFCEIWRFEQYLCCRTCAFEEVCAKTEVFRLPCSAGTSATKRFGKSISRVFT